MPIIVVRLHPKEPTDGDSFAGYLAGLEIEVRERSYANPAGPGTLLGTARYIAEGDANATIVQHWDTMFPIRLPVATAAVEVADPLPFIEYDAPDIALTIRRTVAPNPQQTILSKQVNFNVDLAPGALPAAPIPVVYASLAPVALYLPVPEPLVGVTPGMAVVDVPEDGTAPAFTALRDAINLVLAADPGGAPDLGTLTPEKCRHIANEIVFNRTLDPLPEPPRPLEQLYSGAAETERRQFEADLKTYYTLHNTRADVLAKYIYSVAAALACEDKSQAATKVGFTFPIRPGLSATTEKVGEATVVISQ